MPLVVLFLAVFIGVRVLAAPDADGRRQIAAFRADLDRARERAADAAGPVLQPADDAEWRTLLARHARVHARLASDVAAARPWRGQREKRAASVALDAGPSPPP